MNSPKKRQWIQVTVGIIGGLCLLGLAYALDSWREYANAYYTETFRHLFEIYASHVLGNILLSAAIVGWAWFVLTKCSLNKWLYLVIILPGLVVTFYPLIYYLPAVSILYVAYRLSPAFQIYLTGGIVATVGIVKMLFQGKPPGT
jgi:hypothetical protein